VTGGSGRSRWDDDWTFPETSRRGEQVLVGLSVVATWPKVALRMYMGRGPWTWVLGIMGLELLTVE